MKLSRTPLILALSAALFAPAANAEVAIDVIAGSEISFEGLLQADFNWYNNDMANLNGTAADGLMDNQLRRAELVLKGKGPGNFEWVLGYDVKATKFLDTNIKYKIGGNGSTYVQFGQFKQPNSLEELSSTKNNDFISKAMITNSFAVARRVGLAASYGDTNWSVTGSLFGRELTRNLAQGSGFGLRGTFAPINEKGSILHLGASYVRYNAEQGQPNGNLLDTARMRARPDADLSVRLIDTGNIPFADKISTTGLESFWVHGPFKLQGEYMWTNVSRTVAAQPDLSFTGGYLSGVWNITGESWGYKNGVPTTGLPDEPGRGMFQLGLRYDTMDLNDGNVAIVNNVPVIAGVLGGKMHTLTFGANWYWRSNFKFSLNYVMANSSKFIGKSSATYSRNPLNNNFVFNRVVNDSPNIFEARLQFYW